MRLRHHEGNNIERCHQQIDLGRTRRLLLGQNGVAHNLLAPIRLPNQQLSEGADLIGDEITEGAHTRCPAHVTMDEQIERQSELRYLVEQANQIRLVLYGNHRKWRDARARFDGKHERGRTGAACRNTSMRGDRPHPPRGSMVGNGTVELDHVMLVDIFHRLRRASPLYVRTAGKHRPRHLRDLARHKRVVLRHSGAEGDVGLAFGKIEDFDRPLRVPRGARDSGYETSPAAATLSFGSLRSRGMSRVWCRPVRWRLRQRGAQRL